MVSYSASINAPLSTVWEHFIYKIDHPEHFVPGVSNVAILEKNAAFVLRAMDITSPDGVTARMVEKITFAPYTVRFLIQDHPLFTGYVDNLAEAVTPDETTITFSIHWIHKDSGEQFRNQDLVKNAVLKTIAYMQQAM